MDRLVSFSALYCFWTSFTCPEAYNFLKRSYKYFATANHASVICFCRAMDGVAGAFNEIVVNGYLDSNVRYKVWYDFLTAVDLVFVLTSAMTRYVANSDPGDGRID